MAIKKKLKGAWRSLTIQVNAFALALIPVIQYANDHFEDVRGMVGQDTYKSLALALLVINILLRFKTATALEDKAK